MVEVKKVIANMWEYKSGMYNGNVVHFVRCQNLDFVVNSPDFSTLTTAVLLTVLILHVTFQIRFLLV